MAKLPTTKNELADRIFEHYEKSRDDWRRPHLGASLIGHACDRFLYFSFRWAVSPEFPGRVLRLFSRGDYEEHVMAENLRAVGIKVEDVDPETDDQWRFEWFGGHFGGSCDGLLEGVHEAPKALHVWECKTSNERLYGEVQALGVRIAQPKHAAQMQVYGQGFRDRGMPVHRALYTVTNKNSDEIYAERVKLTPDEAKRHLDRARRIVFTEHAPIRQNETSLECRWCPANSVCHGGEVEKLERNCRTCVSSTALEDGRWRCEHHGHELSTEGQREGCPDHLLRPDMVGLPVTGVDRAARSVSYQRGDETVVDHAAQFETRGACAHAS